MSVARGKSVTGVKRTPDSAPTNNIELVAADVTQRENLESLFEKSFSNDSCDVVVTLTPSNYGEQGYRDSYLACAEALVEIMPNYSPSSRIIFVSSTSVYPENSGNWVTENSDCNASSVTGKVLVEAENALANSDIRHCNLRFSGIYGPGRTRLIEMTKSGRIAPNSPRHWTNRIHADDCAGVLDFLLTLPDEKMPDCLIGTDCNPVPKHDVQKFIANELEVDVPSAIENPGDNQMETGKRCSNKLLLELGYKFLYPGYREGFRALLA